MVHAATNTATKLRKRKKLHNNQIKKMKEKVDKQLLTVLKIKVSFKKGLTINKKSLCKNY